MAIKKKVITQEPVSVVDLISQIIAEGKDLTTKTGEKLAKEKEAKLAAKMKDINKIEQERIILLEQKRKEEIAKNNALYETHWNNVKHFTNKIVNFGKSVTKNITNYFNSWWS